MLYVLYGQNDYARKIFVDSKVAKLKLSRVDIRKDAESVSLDTLLAQDLFSGGQVFVLEGLAERFLTEEQVGALSASENHLFFVEPELDLRTKFAKRIVQDPKITTYEFAAPALADLPVWILEYVKARGGSITEAASVLLCKRLGFIDPIGGLLASLRPVSLARLAQELDKLLMYSSTESISEQAVLALVADDRQVLSLSIADALGKKQKTLLFELLEEYYEDASGEDQTTKTLMLVGLLADQFRSQLQIKSAQSEGITEARILEQTGWKSGRLFVVKRLAAAFSEAQLRSALTKFEALDLELKTTTTPPRVVLELILGQLI
jgi:DNA polymerase III delta subunit